ncbi:MAG: hypothetical protein AAGI03_00525 [Pseudomonadota bacterium]
MKPVFVAVAALALAACAPDADRVNAAKAAAVTAIESLNVAGFDPLKASPDKVVAYVGVCGAAVGLTTVIRPDEPVLSEAGQALCAVIIAAAGEAG